LEGYVETFLFDCNNPLVEKQMIEIELKDSVCPTGANFKPTFFIVKPPQLKNNPDTGEPNQIKANYYSANNITPHELSKLL
jgi:hypothetical protein